MNRIFVFFLLPLATFSWFFSLGQSAISKYPQQYFQWPVGAEIALAANFGELRPNHFHMGLDCKTNQKEFLPVYAAAEGYVAKVKIEPFGFGRCIYINHPNGLTTLYAHLNDFYPALEKYVTQQQYNLQQWAIFIDIPPSLFKVKKGEFIAQSGNTGGSQGPHLHFEIRDTKSDKVLNPLLFGLPIRDNIPPVIFRMAIFDRCISTYEQSPRFYPLRKANGIYIPGGGNLTVNTDRISFGITAFDKYTGSTNQNGIYKACIYDNETAICTFEMDSISYDETRYLNAHIDYKTKNAGGNYIEHLSRLPGNPGGIYKGSSDGVISLEDNQAHRVRIDVWDASHNKSTIEFTIVRAGNLNHSAANTGPMFRPGQVNVFENNFIRFYLPETAIYDSFHFQTSQLNLNNAPAYKVHDASVPLHNYFKLSLSPERVNITDTSRVVMKRSYKTKEEYKKATWDNGWYRSSFRDFGNFQLMQDSIPPTITPIGFRNGMNTARLKKISFLVSDNTKEIKKFTAMLDGKWLRFSNDKGKVFQYVFDEHCAKGNHTITITAEDQVGNLTEKTFSFTR